MPMKKSAAAESPDAYIESLGGWQRRYAGALRSTVVEVAPLHEVIKWGHLVQPGGKYEMATLELVEGTPLERSTVVALVREAAALNAAHGDPTDLGVSP